MHVYSFLEVQNQPGTGKPRPTSLSDLPEKDQSRFMKLVTRGKELTAQGQVKLALQVNKQALAMYHSEKLARRIAKMEVSVGVYMVH